MKTAFKLLFFLLILLTIQSCKTQVAELPAPNIVWITSEDNSKHYIKLFDENGVATPNIESLASQGVVFNHAFSNAPVCSVARSTLITGSYTPRIGAQFHRKIQQVPMPEGLEMFPAYLRQAGYHTTNNSKEDYNLVKSDSVWDDSSKNATWKNRKEGQPFFHVFNLGDSHESRLHFTEEKMKNNPTVTDVNTVFVQPNHPNTDLFKYTNAFYRDRMVHIDKQLGDVVKELEDAGLMDSTIIFYYGDHGGVLPGSKGYIYETGLHVPLVVRVPEKYKHLINAEIGGREDAFVSFKDFGPTVLNLAGVDVPEGMDGKPFMGKNVTEDYLNTCDETYGYADRFDEKYDMLRTLRKGKYKYMRSYQPFNFDGLMNNYRYKQLAYQEWADLYEDGKLNDVQSAFFKERPVELLFDVEADPYETKNLTNNENLKETLLELRGKLNNWVESMPDLSFYPEHFLIENAFDNPVEFGQKHKVDIKRYIDISNLSLLDFEEAKSGIDASLKSSDPWERYWGLITCSIFKEQAKDFVSTIIDISKNDSELINKVRAAEYLGLVKHTEPAEVMTKALYESKQAAEALLIINSIVFMDQGEHKYKFNIDIEKIDKDILKVKELERKLDYISNVINS
ncbi:sulfatase family protein [Seonamhaeicola maritimus]|uniref:Sulfatase n=1 Tax=Seonamhaeicola maritimus TaxID=2591822 RepID=A0A5C7GGM9_9FLAO|nr:sulfatase [Seonamhaeicola maritimus]TXG36114.1 sulfatase [Seonamhaeicola maritimus]